MASTLTFNPQFRLFICQSCQDGVRENEIKTHFRKTHRFSSLQLRTVCDFRDGVLRGVDTPIDPIIPDILEVPIPGLRVYDGHLLCRFSGDGCRHICGRPKEMRRHISVQHGWPSKSVQGRPSAAVRSHREVEKEKWETVRCQRFFPSGHHSQYIWVQAEARPNPAREEVWDTLDTLRTEAQRDSLRRVGEEDRRDFSPWLARAGWVRYLGGLDRTALLDLIAPPDRDAEGADQTLWEAMGQLIALSQETATREAGTFVRIEVNQSEPGRRAVKPLEPYQSDLDLQKQSITWQQIVLFFVRKDREPSPINVRYTFSPSQQVEFNSLRSLLRADPGWSNEAVDGRLLLTPLQATCLRFCLSLLDQQCRTNEYESPLICALAVLGLSDTGWKGPQEYPSILSSVLKVSRFFIVRSAIDQDLESPSSPRGPIVRVTEMTTRFMLRGTHSPVEWILDFRAYGMKIALNTTSEGTVGWIGDQLLYKDIQFSLSDFRAFVHGLLAKTTDILHHDLLFSRTIKTPLPLVRWTTLYDNPSDRQAGWSFLKDPRSSFPVNGDTWLCDVVRQHPHLTLSLLPQSSPSSALPRGVVTYFHSVVEFRTKLLLLIHLTGGQPARMSELLLVRHQNTHQSNHRDLFVEDQLVTIVTRYHKGYSISGEVKLIHRYVPPAVGALIVRYLWLVLPFYERLSLFHRRGVALSPFLWPTENAGERWSTDVVRKALQAESLLGLGQALTVQSYRHVAIALGRRYLREGYRFVDDSADADDRPGGDEEDDILDLQAGHGSRTAGAVYARGLDERQGEVFTRRQLFRNISLDWHQVLGFDPVRRERDIVRGHKRHLTFGHDHEETLFRKWTALRPSHHLSQLRELLGVCAEFRGPQLEIITAVVRRESPIMAVMPTGGGKTLLWLLPASYDIGRVTVVVVPLVALRGELYRRCASHGIPCREWDRRQPPDAAKVVLVTPESAATDAFFTFLTRLRTTQRLDRIVVDECHLLLRTEKEFRPALQQLFKFCRLETPLLFLTATLPPSREEEFKEAMTILSGTLRLFRVRTTRPNIRYLVLRPPRRTILRFLRTQVRSVLVGRVIIYARTVAGVEKLADRLSSVYYHYHHPEKDEHLRRFLSGEDRTIVATNALGLGIDIPDVRLIIHLSPSRTLLDYAQESGRAGRDGLPSRAIILCSSSYISLSRKVDPPLQRFLQGTTAGGECRRKALDDYLDGFTQRTGCEDTEERCDVCAPYEVSFATAHEETRGYIHPRPPILERRRPTQPLPTRSYPRRRTIAVPYYHRENKSKSTKDYQKNSEEEGLSESTEPDQKTSEKESEEESEEESDKKSETESEKESILKEESNKDQDSLSHSPSNSDRYQHRRQVTHRQFLRTTSIDATKAAGLEREEVLQLFHTLYGICLFCYNQHRLERSYEPHLITQCLHPGRAAYSGRGRGLRSRMQWEPYAACYSCGLPQEVCDQFQLGPNGYSITISPCQFPGLMIEVVTGFLGGVNDGRESARRQLRDKA